MKRTLIALLFAAAVAAPTNVARSAPPRFGFFGWSLRGAPRYSAAAEPPSAYRYDPYDYYRDLYPRYYGAFHARTLDNYGVPSGDVGLRGNGIYWTPW